MVRITIMGAIPESSGDLARLVTATPMPVPAMIAKRIARGFGICTISPFFDVGGTKPTSTTAISARAIATQPIAEKLSPSKLTPITAGTIADTNAPSGEMIEIGPSASDA